MLVHGYAVNQVNFFEELKRVRFSFIWRFVPVFNVGGQNMPNLN